jgi:hypothetical protein
MSESKNPRSTLLASGWGLFIVAIVGVLSLFGGCIVAASTDSVRLGYLTILVPIVGAAAILQRLQRRRFGALPTPAPSEELETAADASSRPNPRASGAGYIPVLGVGVCLCIVGTYLRAFWLIAVLGAAMTGGFWRYRSRGDWRDGMAFIGVLVCLYGLIGWYVKWKAG